MAITYAQGTPLSELDPVELGIRLKEAIAEAVPWLEACSGARAGTVPAEGRGRRSKLSAI